MVSIRRIIVDRRCRDGRIVRCMRTGREANESSGPPKKKLLSVTRDRQGETAEGKFGRQKMRRRYGEAPERQRLQQWSGPKTGLALGRRMDMENGVEQEKLHQKDSVFYDYMDKGHLPGFDWNIRDLTKVIYNDPADPNPRKLDAATYPLTSYDKRQLKAAGQVVKPQQSTGYFNSPPSEDTLRKRRTKIENYESLKKELLLMTGATGLVLTPLICSFYSLDAGASYALGASGAMVYVRALSKVTDALPSSNTASGGQSPVDVAAGAVGSQRLLIPVILILVSNRFNFLYGDNFNLHLEIIPIVVGFFSYKVSTLVQAFRDVGLIKK